MFSRVNSLGLMGMESFTVRVEVDISGGLPRMDIVGLPDTAVNEAKNRVRSAVKNTGFEFPPSRVTVNLAPADTRKEGTVYDLPILIGIVKANTNALPMDLDRFGSVPFRLYRVAFSVRPRAAVKRRTSEVFRR